MLNSRLILVLVFGAVSCVAALTAQGQTPPRPTVDEAELLRMFETRRASDDDAAFAVGKEFIRQFPTSETPQAVALRQWMASYEAAKARIAGIQDLNRPGRQPGPGEPSLADTLLWIKSALERSSLYTASVTRFNRPGRTWFDENHAPQLATDSDDAQEREITVTQRLAALQDCLVVVVQEETTTQDLRYFPVQGRKELSFYLSQVDPAGVTVERVDMKRRPRQVVSRWDVRMKPLGTRPLVRRSWTAQTIRREVAENPNTRADFEIGMAFQVTNADVASSLADAVRHAAKLCQPPVVPWDRK